MRMAVAATAFAFVAGAPTGVLACEYVNDTSASAAPSAELASAPAPAVSKSAEAKVSKSPAPDAVKKYADKVKADKPDQKLAANATR